MGMDEILVTGSSGFIGKKLVESLIEDGLKVFELDLVLAEIKGNSRLFDIRDQGIIGLIEDLHPKIIIHCAAKIDVRESFLYPDEYLKTNSLGTANLLRGALMIPGVNFIYLNSGGATYSKNCDLPLTESSVVMPVSPYGLSKQIGEDLLVALSIKNDLKWSSLALSNCFGRVSEHKKGVIYSFWNAISLNQNPCIYGADVTRDFIFIDDVIDAIKLAVKTPSMRRVNISSNTEITLESLFNKISKLMQKSVTPELNPPIEGEILKSRLDNSLAKNIWGWEPLHDLDSALKASGIGKK